MLYTTLQYVMNVKQWCFVTAMREEVLVKMNPTLEHSQYASFQSASFCSDLRLFRVYPDPQSRDPDLIYE